MAKIGLKKKQSLMLKSLTIDDDIFHETCMGTTRRRCKDGLIQGNAEAIVIYIQSVFIVQPRQEALSKPRSPIEMGGDAGCDRRQLLPDLCMPLRTHAGFISGKFLQLQM